jgi:predicted dehydrogenase
MTPFYRAKQLIAEGKIGEPRYCFFEQSNTPEVPLSMLKWAAQSNVIWFLGVHSIDMVEWLLSSRISRVFSRAERGILAARGVDTEDYVISTCELQSGATAVIENSWILPESHTGISTCRCKIVGTKGTLFVDALSSDSLSYSDDQATKALNMFGLNQIDGRSVGSPAASVEHFVDSATAGRAPRVSMEDGLSTVLVATSIIESFSTGGTVDVPRI